MNTTPVISLAGYWTPVDSAQLNTTNTGLIANQFYKLLPKLTGGYDLIIGGWGWAPNQSIVNTKVIIFSQNTDSTLFENTSAILKDPYTNGVGAIVTADFNGDGLPDIVMPSDNEGSLVPLEGVAYISSPNGYIKQSLPGKLLTHDAQLAYSNGKPIIITGVLGGDNNPIYYYDGTSFVESVPKTTPNGNTNIMIPSTTGDWSLMVRGDIGQLTRDQVSGVINWTELNIESFKFNGLDYTDWHPVQKITPYLSTLTQYQNFKSAYGTGVSHVYRIWSDDLNHDGLQDLMAAESMWTGVFGGTFPTTVQLLINNGNDTFRDMTSDLNKDIGLDYNEGDYSPEFVDLDRSGINTYILAGNLDLGYSSRKPNFILLNDGTGRIYVGMHQQFANLSKQLDIYIAAHGLPNGYRLARALDGTLDPNFIGAPQPDGSVNFLAQIVTQSTEQPNGQLHTSYAFFNIGVKYNPTIDFNENVKVLDRNNSKLMRTWAGNDSFTDVNSNSAPAHIDGGLGIDTAIYSQASSSYHSTHNLDGSESIVGNGISDTLVNIERLKFLDKSVAIDISGNAGTTAKILGAVFGKTAITNKEYVGIGLDLLDKGMSYDTLAGLALNAAKATTYDQIVTTLWTNVVGSTPSAADKAPFIKMLEDGMTPGALAHMAADTLYNTANINLVGLTQTGIEYTPVA